MPLEVHGSTRWTPSLCIIASRHAAKGYELAIPPKGQLEHENKLRLQNSFCAARAIYPETRSGTAKPMLDRNPTSKDRGPNLEHRDWIAEVGLFTVHPSHEFHQVPSGKMRSYRPRWQVLGTSGIEISRGFPINSSPADSGICPRGPQKDCRQPYASRQARR